MAKIRALPGAAPSASDPRAGFARLQAEFLAHCGATAASRYLDLRNPAVRVHVLVAGDPAAEPLLIIHGGDGEGADWAPLIARLQSRFRIYAIDRPGFGLSDPFDYRGVDLPRHARDVVASVLDALGLETVTLAGGSMGGFFSLNAALALPARIRRLILIGFPLGLTSKLALPLRLLCGIPGLARLFMRNAASVDKQRAQYRNLFRIDPDTLPDLYFRLRAAGAGIPGAATTWAVLLRKVGGIGGLRPGIYLGAALPSLRAPTLCIWGARDDMASIEDGAAAVAAIPEGRFEVLEGVGHFPFLEVPDVCARLVLEFLGKSDGVEAGRV